jgi:hypothetical protein
VAASQQVPSPSIPQAPAPSARPLPPTSRAKYRNWDEFRLHAGRRLVQANPNGTFTSAVPQPLLAIPVLEVELAGSSFDDPMGPGVGPRRWGVGARLRHGDRSCRTGRPEPDVDHVGEVVDADVRDAMGESGKVVAVVDHPCEPNSRVVAEFAQHGEQQAVVLEAVSAASAHHDAIEQLLGLERQRVVQADTDAAERERSDVPADDLGEELERRLAWLETEGYAMA